MSQESKDYRVRELEKLKSDYDALLGEKEAVEQEYILFRKEVKHSTAGASAKVIVTTLSDLLKLIFH